MQKQDYLELLKWVGEELEMKLGHKGTFIPLDKKNADLVYLTNTRDIKYMPLSILAAAEIFHAAQQNWTMPSEGWDAEACFHVSDARTLAHSGQRRLLAHLKPLKPGKIVLSECGITAGPSKWTNFSTSAVEMEFPVESLLHTMVDYVKSGRIRLDPAKNADPVTYHDPCIMGKHYGVTEEPRFLLSKAVSSLIEMYPNRSENWCCLGSRGAGVERNSRKAELSMIKKDQLLRTGAKVVATSCPNCIDGLNRLIWEHNLDLKVKPVSELVADALVF